MTGRRGGVWYNERRVGTLREDQPGALLFAYGSDWLDEGEFPISIHLPLSNGDRETEGHAFFEGLLPEGRVRRRICRRLGIAFEDDMGLLLAIGEDCAGALSILPAETEPTVDRGEPAPLAAEQIDRLVRSRGSDSAALGDAPQRISLAGAQEKQPVIYDGARYALPDRAHPSSHILKFETVPYVCFAECLANDMASRIGLPVPAVEYLCVEEAPFLRIARYDRAPDATGALRRLHQEDLMQALGLPAALKYQRDGGPSIAEVAVVLREHTARPVQALARLRDWQIFNYLIGNSDAHAKNLALLYAPDPSAPMLAPFYDLVAIECLNLLRPASWARDMALNVGAHAVPERVTRQDWEGFAKHLGSPPKRVLARLDELSASMPEVAASARESFARAHGDAAAYDCLEESVRRRCRWMRRSVFGER